MSKAMPDNHYENPRLTELYDLDSPWSADREFYLELAGSAQKPMDILDLGCGTGLLCDAYAAKGHSVTGVDPSAAMLTVARKKPNGTAIDWVNASAQDYRSDKRFDLIIMTGHAFQVLLTDEDITAAFKTMKHHLKPDGLAVFESRNPSIDWRSQWDYDMELQLPSGAVKESRRFKQLKNSRMTFELRYKFPDEELISQSELRFAAQSEIEKLLLKAGLQLEKIMGDWDWSPFDPTDSQEMIFFAQ